MTTDRWFTAKLVLAFATIYIIWGTTYLAIHYALDTLPPFLMAGVRFVLAGGVLFAAIWRPGMPLPTRRHWLSALIAGSLMLVGGNGLVTLAEVHIPSGIAALVVATMPLWMALMDWLFFGGVRPSLQAAIGLILGFVGVLVLLRPDELQVGGGLHLPSMAVLMLAPVLWSIGSLYSRRAEQPKSLPMGAAIQMLAGGVVLLGLSITLGEWRGFNPLAVSMVSITWVLYLILFGSIAAYIAYLWLLKVVDAGKVATYAYVNPVIAVLLGWLIAGEAFTGWTALATAFIVVAVVLVTTSRNRKVLKVAVPESTPDPAPASAD